MLYSLLLVALASAGTPSPTCAPYDTAQTAVGAQLDTNNTDQIVAQQIAVPTPGYLTSLHFYLVTADVGCTLRTGVYRCACWLL